MIADIFQLKILMEECFKLLPLVFTDDNFEDWPQMKAMGKVEEMKELMKCVVGNWELFEGKVKLVWFLIFSI